MFRFGNVFLSVPSIQSEAMLVRGERVMAGRIYTIAAAARGEEVSGVVGLMLNWALLFDISRVPYHSIAYKRGGHLSLGYPAWVFEMRNGGNIGCRSSFVMAYRQGWAG